ncbi:tetratricopeptide repeat protein [Nostoc sp. ChiVER01]|uniref:tetratricopeptide repeat protein n=1 Tax=Nostoc sp. ChiVER01 TaxID=3075382 RepID=UPI002AD56AF6|nr:tetratricopeptide repeat protein [Nostoc sp. ChiVER01]MDZ8225165.1 tetratricopeptide repeat protein [Nostoc sp. ChiVER01]
MRFGLEIPQELGGRFLSLKEQVAWCWSKYPNSELPILIVFDDVTNLDNLRQVVPDDNRFQVLITTRLRHLDPNFIQEIPLDILSPQKEPGKALELLKLLLGKKDKRVENQLQTATNICECLEYLPLGIELVGGYLVRDLEISLDMMFGRLQERKLAEAALQDRETLNSTQLGVKAAFDLNWSELDPLAQQLGKFLSLFSPVQILWDLVIWVATGGGKAENQEQRQLTWSEDELNAAKNQLYGRNLLQLIEEREGYYKIHALVRWFLQEELGNSGETKSVLETTFVTAMIALAQILSDSPTSEQIESIRDMVSHLEDLGKHLIAEIKEAKEKQIISSASVPNDKVIWIFVGIGRFYEGQGLYNLAEPWRKECLNVCQELFATDHPNVATSLNNLAALYESQGRYNEAEPLYSQALTMRKCLFDSDHPDVAQSLNNLAKLYNSQGRYSKAEPLFNDALEMTKRLFVGDHPNVATSLNNLAGLYNSQGRYSEAEPFFSDALAMRKRLFVGDHPNVATSLNNLAGLYNNQGRYSEAEPLFSDALAMTKRLFNSDHPDVAGSLNNLAGLYHSQGRYSEAELLCSNALAMRKRLFDVDHPDVAGSLNNLALLYHSQGRYNEAKSLYTNALAMRKRLFDGDHPDVASSLNNLAAFYESQGQYNEAEPLFSDALEMTKRLFVGDHPNVATSLNNLAFLYKSQGRYNEAEPLFSDALAMTKRLLNGDHLNVATGLNNLAVIYENQGRYNEAEPLYSQALAMTKRLFDRDHPNVATSLNNLALLYHSQGRYSEAKPFYAQALAMCDRILGVNHPTTATIRENLAILQRQSTPRTIRKGRLGQFVQTLKAILILPFSLLWRFIKKLIRN